MSDVWFWFWIIIGLTIGISIVFLAKIRRRSSECKAALEEYRKRFVDPMCTPEIQCEEGECGRTADIPSWPKDNVRYHADVFLVEDLKVNENKLKERVWDFIWELQPWFGISLKLLDEDPELRELMEIIEVIYNPCSDLAVCLDGLEGRSAFYTPRIRTALRHEGILEEMIATTMIRSDVFEKMAKEGAEKRR